MTGRNRRLSRIVLAVAIAAGIVLQGSVAYASPAVTPPPGVPATTTPGDQVAEDDPVTDPGTDPAEPVDPEVPVDPEPTDPTDPMEPGDPTEPVDPGIPTDDPEPTTPAPTETPTPTKAPSPSTNSTTPEPSGLADSGVAAATAPQLVGFKPGYIISDSNFYNGSAMSAAQIQTFLNQRVPRCTLGDPGREMGKPWGSTTLAWACLKNAKWNTTTLTRPANAYCKAYRGASSETSAQVIAKVGQACGISPRVLLVMLEKEQSLVSDSWPTALQFNRAMGYNCPDSGPNNSANCNPNDTGFMQQVYRAAWQLKVYRALPNNYRYQPFKNNTIQWHPNIGCGTSNVYIENRATAALYIYTPYRPNQAALDAGWGTGDSCSSYGNRNFYQMYKQWFGTPNTFFPDVSQNHKFFKEIEWMGTSGLSTGIKSANGSEALYKPYYKVSREAMAAFLYRLEKSTYRGPATSPFADVKRGDPFYNEIAWMYQKGYSTGIAQPSGKPRYEPKSQVSREAMAAFIYRLNNATYQGPATSPFSDMRKGDKFYNEITWMYQQKLSTGIAQPSGKPKYAPKDRVSREAMAAFIYRLKS